MTKADVTKMKKKDTKTFTGFMQKKKTFTGVYNTKPKAIRKMQSNITS